MTTQWSSFLVLVLTLTLTLPACDSHLSLDNGPVMTATKMNSLTARRCSVELANTLTGRGPPASWEGDTAPLKRASELVKTEAFADKLASFLNRELNVVHGRTVGENAVYYIAKDVILKSRPYADLFRGKLKLNADGSVDEDENGLGIYGVPEYQILNAGTEPEGILLLQAARTLRAITGMTAPPADMAAVNEAAGKGRQIASCSGCHYASLSLDLVANSFQEVRDGPSQSGKFKPHDFGPQTIWGKTISSRKELIDVLLASDDFAVQTCNVAFKFVTGRLPYECEAERFDRCVDDFQKEQTINAAVLAIIQDNECGVAP